MHIAQDAFPPATIITKTSERRERRAQKSTENEIEKQRRDNREKTNTDEETLGSEIRAINVISQLLFPMATTTTITKKKQPQKFLYG